ncbi:N-ethylmaleimide reductase [Brevundimonas vesicularis]|uniref:N-ethylmaleimide reductase n=1 Tax=Brevundimonas vesicularis TaxID=41276 RepID=A0A2X1BFD3_BREVE|nr:alkene reductase [Brevundimonas vesicularis]SPU54809.1 N-ethylmaleimide reductase [Brevundimonas vesicularis]
MPDLFAPYDLHGLALPNRIAMSAMTRTRASETGVPTDLMRDYYVQRASAGLIVTECTQVSEQGHGIIRCPGIHTADQIAGWRKVTDAVHDAGGRIYVQLWHCGRVAHPEMRGGEPPVGPSPLPAEGDFFLPRGRVEFPTPRPLELEEIAPIVEDFAQATRNAREAGFDGVELHGANGYLQDQFLQDGSNHRSDAYGGGVANRARLMIETAEAMIAAWSAERVGIRLSPSSSLYGMKDSDPRETFGHLVSTLDALEIGYITLLEPNAKDAKKGVQIEHVVETLGPLTSRPLIVNTGFDKAKGNEAIASGFVNLVAYGVPYIANPDLVERFRADAALNKPDPETFYGEGPTGYTDYPAMANETTR